MHLKPQLWEAGGAKCIWSQCDEKLVVPSAFETKVVRSWWSQVHLIPQWWEAKFIWNHICEKLVVPSASEATVVRSWWCQVHLKPQWWKTSGAKCIWSQNHSGEKLVVPSASDAKCLTNCMFFSNNFWMMLIFFWNNFCRKTHFYHVWHQIAKRFHNNTYFSNNFWIVLYKYTFLSCFT